MRHPTGKAAIWILLHYGPTRGWLMAVHSSISIWRARPNAMQMVRALPAPTALPRQEPICTSAAKVELLRVKV